MLVELVAGDEERCVGDADEERCVGDADEDMGIMWDCT